MMSGPAVGAMAIRDVRREQAQRADWANAASGPWNDASALLAHLKESTNIIRAAEQFDWTGLIGPGAAVLDLGCGSGWLSALLSARPEVQKVVAWDSSEQMLTDVLPRMVWLMNGDPRKIDPVCGQFVPLLLDEGSLDLVVMSSAFHHSDDPLALLAEIRRALKPSGSLVLLNETPWHTVSMLRFVMRLTLTALTSMFGGQRRMPGAIYDDHVLYDAALGDHAWTKRGWSRLATQAGWSIAIHDSGLYSYTDSYRRAGRFESPLTHFVLRPGNYVPST